NVCPPPIGLKWPPKPPLRKPPPWKPPPPNPPPWKPPPPKPPPWKPPPPKPPPWPPPPRANDTVGWIRTTVESTNKALYNFRMMLPPLGRSRSQWKDIFRCGIISVIEGRSPSTDCEPTIDHYSDASAQTLPRLPGRRPLASYGER